ncbi:hypothetical protein KIN20_008409 [Parelaphostrongylus tenuis]|uniref:Uncharacterized protein n=1 Tax=Parelaphostrongylus tenuis TaxID=148309 RepID=A0AAD5MR53_PARTN|nr:hypothetical protein KIN20_008409 [Parelaphostrongylus tenuis]
MKTLYKGQDKDRKQWLNEILNFRFPSGTVEETRSKMGNAIAAIKQKRSEAFRMQSRKLTDNLFWFMPQCRVYFIVIGLSEA